MASSTDIKLIRFDFVKSVAKGDTKCPVRVLPTCYTTGSNMYNMTNHAQIIFCSVNCLPYCHIYHVSACTSTVIEKGGFRLDLCCCQRPSIPHIMAASINWDIPSATPHLTIISICWFWLSWKKLLQYDIHPNQLFHSHILTVFALYRTGYIISIITNFFHSHTSFCLNACAH